MAELYTLRDPIREARLFRNRIVVAAALTGLLLAILAARLVYLQLLSHEHYTTLSHNNRVDILPIAPTRGLIYDRNGVVLAENVPTFSLDIIPERVLDLETTLEEIATLIEISAGDLARFRNHLRRKRRFEEVPLRVGLTDDEVAIITVNRHRLPGVEINSRLSRHYPMGELTAHVVGYMGRIDEDELRRVDASNYSGTSHIGKVGIERAYENLLHGKVGFQQVETNARRRILHVLDRTPPVPGHDLHLNIDIRLQAAAHEAFGEERGALVAVDPNTGGVLALVSIPGYDPNPFFNGISAKEYEELSASRDRPLFNRAMRGQYPPGSTIKPFIGLAGLELGEIRPNHRVPCPGFYMLKNDERRYRDWKRTGHGQVDVEKAIVESCDVFFYDLALNLGIDRLSDYMQHFGFGHRTGIDLIGEGPGLMPTRAWKRQAHQQPWFPGETLITGIGQGFFLTTPLQLAVNTAALAAEGKRMRPKVLRATYDPTSGNTELVEPERLEPVRMNSRDNWQHIIRSMVNVVHGTAGTARRISRELPFQIAGKTGTAQVFGLEQDAEYIEEEVAKRLRDHALFVAFAPAERPEIAIAVIVENGGSGGAVAAPVARAVMDRFFDLVPQQQVAEKEGR